MKKLAFLFYLIPVVIWAQSNTAAVSTATVVFAGPIPSGSCTVGTPAEIVLVSGTLYTCQNGTWAQVGAASGISLTTTGTTGAATLSGGTLNIPVYQGALTLTTTGTSGAATLSGNTLNIPQYSTSGGSGNYVNLGGSVTWSGCTYASGTCVVGSGGSATLSITSIPGTYQALKVFVNGAESGSSNGAWRWVFNSDTGSHYAWAYGAVTLTGSSGNGQASATVCGMSGILNSSGEITIHQYANTNIGNKMMTGLCALPLNATAAGAPGLYYAAGQWNNTAAISSIAITVADGSNFLQNSTVQIYGVN